MTLYASATDKALVLSRTIARNPVFSDDSIVSEKFESIDLGAIGKEIFGLSHNVFAANRFLVDDIGRLVLRGERPPHRAFASNTAGAGRR